MEHRGKFVIECDPAFKNPKGYTRATQRTLWTQSYLQYKEWIDHVRRAFLRGCDVLRVPDKQKCRLVVEIFFRNHARPDPDNVYKGIADALADHKGREFLYKNDKYVVGEFDYSIDKERPRVVVDIWF